MSQLQRRFLLPAALICCTAVAVAQGVDNPLGVFQLEGNTSKDNTICFLPVASGGPAIATPGTYPTGPSTTTPPNSCPTVDQSGNPATWTLVTFGATTDDWASFAFSGGKFTSKSNAIFVPAYVGDAKNSQADTAFLGASSKDTQDLTQWNWTTSKPQAKDDIVNAFATAYKLNGHTGIYFGMDRLDGSGDATAGFWFVQDSTFAMCTGNGTDTKGANPLCTANGTFVGKHFNGDLLIVSDFSNGGTVSTINVFEWQSGQLVLSQSRSPAPCDIQLDNSSLCGVVNNAFTQVLNNRGNPVLSAITVSPGGWPFGDKSGSSTYLTGEFLEGAVDLNAIFGDNIPCFSTFFAETRSSTSANATLSDVTPPTSFPLCSLTVTKACTGSTVVNGNQIQYNFSGSIINTGSSTLYSPVVYDTPPSSIVANSLSLTQPTGPIGAGQSASYSGSFVSSALLSSTDKNLVSGAASSSSSGTPLNVVCGANPPTSTDRCADWGDPTAGSCPPTITKGLTLTKACKSCLEGGTNVHVAVSEAFKVCNTSNVNVSGISVLDCRGTISGSPGSQTCSAGSFVTIGSNLSLNAAADATHPTCLNLSSSYTPTVAAASYSDQAIASGTAALGGGTIYANAGTPAQATCPVCPIATDCPTNPPVAACPTGLVCP